ncbi:uncharacterized protein B0T15DRAFT_419132 [Chaetomium strumarium]|uniref:Uncharacterized protein n=1 Tax=Chaetomium strumarium TaxID=1170767 RepID=A0AAJ0GRF0_9PEZI|nr:hypothetical protein B0T15DRAFT_419132 [Chaetomium strumarium]
MGQWHSQPTCLTPACIHAASHILQNLAPNWAEMDPCTQFDKMVCYGYPEHKHGENADFFSAVGERNLNILKRILDSASDAEADSVVSTLLTTRSSGSSYDEYNFDLLKTGYQACMDTDTIAAAGVKPLQGLVSRLNEIWPLQLPGDLNTTISSAGDYDGLHGAVAFLEQFGVKTVTSQCFEDTLVMPDLLDSKVSRVCFNVPDPVPTNYSIYADAGALKRYITGVAQALYLAYEELDEAGATALAAAVVTFESDLLQLEVPYLQAVEEDGDYWNFIKTVSVADVAKAAPAVGLDKLVAALTPADSTPTDILLVVPDFWAEFSTLLESHSKAAVQGFLVWKAINEVAPYIMEEHLAAAVGYEDPRERWQTCVAAADTMLRHILDHYFVQATYPNLTLQAADRMTTDLRAAFKKRLGELDWMSAESRARAIKKVENMNQNIGYPTADPDLTSPQSLAAYYDGLNFTATSYFANMLAARRHTTLKAYAEVARPPNRVSFSGSVTTVNAWYHPLTNSMIIPAGISQLPLFHYHLPDYALYGGLGSVIGHEITHGFDNNGRLWNENAEHRAWWDNSTISSFQSRAQCFVDQYSQFSVPIPASDSGSGSSQSQSVQKGQVSGELTLPENLADSGGLRAAYDAWVADRKNMPEAWDQDLPGLDEFTHEQLFFIFWGNLWCDYSTPERNELVLQDVHAPHSARILGMAANSRAFREAWNCPVKEPVCELF